MYYEAQDTSIPANQQRANLRIMNQQQDITDFEAQFNGPFPFTSDGVVVGTPSASFEEEMQTMITFAGGTIDLDTFYHENMHQWWGDHVTEAGLQHDLLQGGSGHLGRVPLSRPEEARVRPAVPPARPDGRLSKPAWWLSSTPTTATGPASGTEAPSNPTPATLFATAVTYERPGAAYIALRQILGSRTSTTSWPVSRAATAAGTSTRPSWKRPSTRGWPTGAAACSQRLDDFFTEWFDTAYRSGGGKNRPQITGPGLDGPGFYSNGGGCR